MITVLIATYNGAEFLQAQLDSIANQSFQDFTVLIRDDGSTDQTCALISGHPLAGRVTLLRNEGGARGPQHNFAALLQQAARSGAKYFALADQDDAWYPDKLVRQLEALQILEDDQDEVPALVFCDSAMIDEAGKALAPSFMQAQNLALPERDPLKTLLLHNVATGNGMLFNRALLECALPLDESMLMHDWWLMLNAAAEGRIRYINSPLLDYRQHQSNQVGLVTPLSLLKRPFLSCSGLVKEGQNKLTLSFDQARALSFRLAQRNPENDAISLTNRFAGLTEHRRVDRLAQVRRHGFRAQGRLRHWWFLARLLMLRRTGAQ